MALYKDGNPVSGLNSIPRLTLAQYNALNVKPEFWVRTDAPESYKKLSADQVSYDSNNTVKDKIDELEAHNTNAQGAVSLSNNVTVTVEAPKDCYLTIRSTNNDTLVGVYLYNTAVSLGQIRATSTAEWGAYTLFMRKGTKLDVQALGTHGFYQITLLE